MLMIVGIEKVDYKNKQGNRVVGTKLHINCEDLSNKNLDGVSCSTEWIPNNVELPNGLAVGDEVSLYYNKYGRVDSVVKK